mgnify:CR=1 FL=1
MNKTKKIIICITGILLITLILVGLTYAYFLTKIKGNMNEKSISVSTANLELVYKDESPNIEVDALMPGTTIGTKSFSVTSKSNVNVKYGVFVENLVYKFDYPTITYTLKCTSSKGTECNSISSTSFPTTNDLLVSNDIEPGEVQTYDLTVYYGDNGLDQSNDMNKEFSGKIQIYDLKNTIDIKGKVENYSSNDYVRVSSNDPKISQINNEGEYKVVGVKPENHEITLFKKDDTGYKEYKSNFIVEQSKSEEIVDSTYKVNNDTRMIIMDVKQSENSLSITNNDFVKYEDGKYYSDISDSVVYANYTLTTVATQAPVEDDSISMADDKIGLLSNKFDNKLAWFTDTATATLKIKYDGTKSSNTINQVSKIQASNLDVNMYLDDNESVKDFVYDGEVDWDEQFEFNLKITNEGTLALKYKTILTINNVDVDKLKKYLYVEVYDEDDNLISEGSEITLNENVLKAGENHIYKVIIMLKV